MEKRRLLERTVIALILVVVATLTVFTISIADRNSGVQDAIRLESRVNQLEQRLYTMEISVRNIEQQSRLSATTARSGNGEDLLHLNSDIQLLQRRLADDECAIARLDERTLPRETRDTRRRTTANRIDPCRAQVDTPVLLPDRP